jgi:hypothetical protein
MALERDKLLNLLQKAIEATDNSLEALIDLNYIHKQTEQKEGII